MIDVDWLALIGLRGFVNHLLSFISLALYFNLSFISTRW